MNKTKKTRLYIIITLFVLIAGAVGTWYYLTRGDKTDTSSKTGYVNLDPPTEEEKQQAEDTKQQTIDDETKNEDTPPDNVRSVTPLITYADQYGNDVEVGSYVPGVVESGGTCTATFTRGSSSFTRSVTSIQDAQNTSCPVITAPLSAFASKGSWSVTIRYQSPAASGSSSAKSFEVK